MKRKIMVSTKELSACHTLYSVFPNLSNLPAVIRNMYPWWSEAKIRVIIAALQDPTCKFEYVSHCHE